MEEMTGKGVVPKEDLASMIVSNLKSFLGERISQMNLKKARPILNPANLPRMLNDHSEKKNKK